MAWDDLTDMWWMQKPEKSNLPELAVGAFMQGMSQAQRRAEFNAEMPLKIAESNARTAAQVAQSNIAQKKFQREAAEWEREDKEDPILSEFTQGLRNWYETPPLPGVSPAPAPTIPAGLTGSRLVQAQKMALDASLMKQQQENKTLAAQVALENQKDVLDLAANYGLSLDQAKDKDAVMMAKLRRNNQKALEIESKYGITIPKEGIQIPTTSKGDLDVVAYESMVKKLVPPPTAQAGMAVTKVTTKDALGREIVSEAPKSDTDKTAAKLEEERIKFMTDQAKAGIPAIEAAKQWEQISMFREGVPKVGTSAENPLDYVEKMEVPASGAWVRIKAGTKIGGEKYEEDSVRWFGPRQAQPAEPTEVTLPTGSAYKFTTEDAEEVQRLESKVTDLRSKLDKVGVSAPSQRMMSVGPGARPVSIPASTGEKKAYDARVKKLLKDLSEAEEQLKEARGK